MKHNCLTKERTNGDLLLEINIEDVPVSSSRETSSKYLGSSDMDRADLWEVTIVPPSTQAVSLSGPTVPLVKILNATSERASERNLHRPFDGSKRREEEPRGNSDRSKIVPLSFAYRRSNRRDDSRQPFNSNERFVSVLCGEEEELDKMLNTRVRVCGSAGNESSTPFVELGAVYKILDFIMDSDPKISSLTSSCCNEILNTLQCLIARCRDKKLEDLLSSDPSLHRCERCGVISRTVCDDRNEKKTISASPSDLKGNLKNNTRSGTGANNFEVDRQAKYKDELNGTQALPVKERAFAIRSRIEDANHAVISDADGGNVKIKNTSRFNNNAIRRLFANSETMKRGKRYEVNDTARDNCVDISKEKIVKKISYEHKSQMDNFLVAGRCLKSAQRSQGLRLSEKDGRNISSIADTVKYLTHSTYVDKKESDVLSKLQEQHRVQPDSATRRQSFVLHDSRDDCPQCDPGFWLFNKSGCLLGAALGDRRLPTSKLNDINNFRTHISQYSDTGKEMDSRIECVEKDSLETCVPLERTKESDTTVSSSSAENLIREWMASLSERDVASDIDGDIFLGRRLISSKPSLDIARHVREIAKCDHLDDAKRLRRKTPMHDSDAFTRLSPEIRREICHLIERMLSSGSVKNSMLHHEKTLMANASSSDRLSHSESVDAAFGKSLTASNKMKDPWVRMDDYIPTKLSKLPEDDDRLRRGNDEVKGDVKIPHERSIASVSLDETREIEFACSAPRKIVRRIIYKNMTPNTVGDDVSECVAAEILQVYRRILENSEDLDWDAFRKLVEVLHPAQKELWRDICKTVSEETRKVAGDANVSTDICIEISPMFLEEASKTSEVTSRAREIVFELEMTLKNVEGLLNERPRFAKRRLDTHENANEGVGTGSGKTGRKTISRLTH